MSSLFKGLIFLSIAIVLASMPVQAATYSWNKLTWGYVDTASNWTPSTGIPGSATGDRVFVNNGGLALTDATHAFGSNPLNAAVNEYSLQVGGAGTTSGALQQSGGMVNTVKGLCVGTGGYGYYGISDGTLTVNSAGWTDGIDPTIDPKNESIVIGNGGPAVFNQTGGTVNMTLSAAGYPNYAGTRFIMGAAGTADSLANFRGGTFNGPTYVGAVPDMAFVMGWNGIASGNNTLNIGGTALVDLTHGGSTPTGRLLMGNGGVLNTLNLGDVKSSLGGSGGANGGGGTLVTATISNPGGSPSVVNFHGGTLQASSALPVYGLPSFLSVYNAYVYSEGAVIDTRSFNVIVDTPLDTPAGNGVTGIAMSTGGSGFIGEPIVTLTDSGGTGTGATARAIVDLDPTHTTTFGTVTGLVITNPGINYTGTVTASFTGGGPASVAPTVGTITTTANESGGLTKIGSGTLTLNANCSYTGATTIEAGKLVLNNINFASSAITVKNTGTLAGVSSIDGGSTYIVYPETTVETGGTIAPGTKGPALQLSKLNLQNNANLHFSIDSVYSNFDPLEVLGDISRVGTDPITVKVTYSGAVTQPYPILSIPFSATGSLDDQITFTIGSVLDSDDGKTKPVTVSWTSGANGLVTLNPGGSITTDPVWNTTAPGATWNTPGSWSPATVPNDGGLRAMFTGHLGGVNIPVSLNTSPQVSSMIFDSPEGQSYTITPTSSDKYIKLHSTMADNWHISVLGGTHIVDADLHLGKGTDQSAIRLVDNSHLTLSRALSDEITSPSTPAGINVEGNFNLGTLGNGILTLSGASTYTGKTTVTNAVLEVASLANVDVANPLGKSPAAPANFVLDNSTLRYTGTAAASTNRGMTVTGSVTLQLGGNAALSGQILGDASTSLTINGPGKMTLDSATMTLTDEADKGNLWLGDGVATVMNVNGTSEVNVRTLLVGKTGGADAGVGGAIYQTGGVVNVLGDGQNPYDNSFKGEVIGHSAYGYYKISDGVLNINVNARSGYNPFIIGLNAPGVFEQTGGAVNNPATDNFLVGVGASSVMNVTGGVFQTSHTGPSGGIILGTFHDGTLNIGGGSTAATVDTAAGIVVLGRFEARGMINLAANGTLKTGGIYNGLTIIPGEVPGTSIFNFHGGTLRVGSAILHPAATSLMENLDHAYVYAEGGVIDTNELDATIAQVLESPTDSGVKRIDVGDGGGSGYIGAPVVTVSSSATGSGATAIAVMNGDKVDHITITNPGSGYLSGDVLTVTLSGGGFTTAATATIGTGSTYFAANTSGTLEKRGLGTLTLTAANTYVGPTKVTGGTLSIGSIADGGAASPIGASTSASGNLVLDGGSLLYTGTDNPTTNRGFTVGPNIGTIASDGNLTFSGSVTQSAPNGGLTKAGTGTLTLTGPVNYNGPTAINAGTLAFSGGATSSVGAVTGAGSLSVSGTGTTLTASSIRVGTLSIGGAASAAAVPEPGTLALLALACLSLSGMAWRKRK